MGHLLVCLFRARLQGTKDSKFDVLLKRLLHVWTQAVECGVEQALFSSCPDPVVAGKVHPFQVASRKKGSKALQLSMMSRFQSRGGAFVSMKTEKANLADLGIVGRQSNLSGRTASEFVARTLVKTSTFMSELVQQQEGRVLNFCFDMAHIGDEHAPGLHDTYLPFLLIPWPWLLTPKCLKQWLLLFGNLTSSREGRVEQIVAH